VKVGGPLRGYNRALLVSARYSVCSFFIGAVLIIGAAAIFSTRDFVGVAGGFVFFHFWITAGLFLTSLPANLLFARLFRGRTWRNEWWRSWTAGALGVVITTGGMVVMGLSGTRPPPVLRQFGELAGCLYVVGWFVLFSNLALLVAWALPSRKR